MALLLLAILRDGKPRTAEEIAAAAAPMIRALREDDTPAPRDLRGAGGSDPGGGAAHES